MTSPTKEQNLCTEHRHRGVWRREGWNKAEQTKYAFAMNMKAIFAEKISQ